MDTVLSNVDKFKDAANVLYVYGPFALILVFIFIAEWRIRPSMKDSTGQVAKVAVGTYIVVWLLVLGFAITCVFAWYKLNIHNESVVKGTFENVNGLETVTSDHPSLWLQRTYGGHDGSYNYSWQLISEKPLLQGQIVDFYLNRPGKKDGNPEGLKISLNVRTEFYKVQPVKLQFDRRSDSVFLVLNQKREPVALEPLAAVKGSMGSNESIGHITIWDAICNSLIPNAYADVTASNSVNALDLASPDPIIRNNAQKQVLGAGPEGVRTLYTALADPKISNVAHSKILSLLATTPAVTSANLAPAQKTLLIDACASSNPQDRSNAIRIIDRLAGDEYDNVLAERIKIERQKAAPDQNRISGFSRARMDLLYKAAISEKKLYGSKKAEDKPRILKAFSLFEEGFDLNKQATPLDKVFFAKAHYGWAQAIHDRSLIERMQNNERNPAYVTAAKNKFQQFLDYLNTVPNALEYPYQYHITRARAYVKYPEPVLGLYSYGVPDSVHYSVADKLRDQCYPLDERFNYPVREPKPAWMSVKSTVIYYAAAARSQAESIASLLGELTGQPFSLARGNDQTVPRDADSLSFFIIHNVGKK